MKIKVNFKVISKLISFILRKITEAKECNYSYSELFEDQASRN